MDLAGNPNGKVKRVINVHELAELLTLVNEMKKTASEATAMHDFNRAVTSNIQIEILLSGVRSIRKEENQLIEDVINDASTNLIDAALKNWEWSRAKKACNKVFFFKLLYIFFSYFQTRVCISRIKKYTHILIYYNCFYRFWHVAVASKFI